ncbi:Serine/threonine-protein phosphatase 4 regulatory subunit 3 [Nymphon striatum]|nr:Serine/threonine-protein phosphatase 4 regulatory subunit 3 [Nymphon striatum]
MADTRRRVKLYALNSDRQWDDRGTGHVSSSFVESLKGISLLVKAEADAGITTLLESKILPDTAYQKQQETLIVWSEGENYDLALSFQEKAGCDEIWEKICEVQGKDPSVEITQDIVEESEDERFEDMSDSGPPIELPPCECERLDEINEVITSCLPSPIRREKAALVIESECYVKKLIQIFKMCENTKNIDALHQLYEIFKNMFMLNKNSVFELMFAEDTIYDVVGCLEYDPSSNVKKNHRDYLFRQTQFREVVPFNNPLLKTKIQQTFRVQYIQDVVLPPPSVFEENMMSTLGSFIFFNKVEIVGLIQDDEKFLTDLFNELMDETTHDSRKRDLVLFLKEFCTFSQTLQPQNREKFFKTLSTNGILQVLELTLSIEDEVIKSASIDILTHVVEFNPSMVRDYTLQQVSSVEDSQLLINILVEQMICDSDPEMGGAVQLSCLLRLLLDPENMMAEANKSEKTDFLNFFYKHCIHFLIAPLLANTTEDSPTKEDYQTVQLLGLILELLSFCVEHHTYHIKNYILNKDLLRRILVLMKSKHKFLVLCALRFMRRIISLKDEFYNRYIIKGNLFAPVIDAFKRNNFRYNLLDSAIIEMFEFIKMEDIKALCTHVVEMFGKIFDKVEYVQTFKALKIRFDQDRTSLETMSSMLRKFRSRRDPRQLDEEEELWFNEDDEEKDASITVTDMLNKKLDDFDQIDQIGKIIDERETEKDGFRTVAQKVIGTPIVNRSNSPQNNSPPPILPTIDVKSQSLARKGLVDYPDEDSDEEEEEEEEEENDDQDLHPSKRPRLSPS